MEKKKQKKKKKLGALLLLLFLTVVLLATSTYAWFTSNRTVTIADIDVEVAAQGGIQISTDAVTWKTVLKANDINTGYSYQYVPEGETNPVTATDTNQLPSTLEPVSTAGTVLNTAGKKGFLQMFQATVNANTTTGNFELTAEQVNETKGTTGKYIVFDIFLKLDSAANVYIQKGTGAVNTATKEDKGLQNATRIALVNEGTVNADTETATVLALNNATADSVTIYEPYAGSHTSFGVIQADAYYKTYTNYNAISAGDTNPTVSYDGVLAAVTTPIVLNQTNATNNSTYFKTMTTVPLQKDFVEGTASANLLYKTSFPKGITKLRVYMWIEGQDVDCENNASGAFLTYKLAFTLDA